MKNQTTVKPLDSVEADFSFQVVEWRDKNGHLLAQIIVGQDKVYISIKCHRCKHVEEKEVGSIVD